MSKLIVVMVDMNKEPGCPSTFCIKPSVALLNTIRNVRDSVAFYNSGQLNGVMISFDWEDEGVWIEDRITEVEGMDYESIVKQCSVSEVTDFRVEVSEKSVVFHAIYQDEEIFTHCVQDIDDRKYCWEGL